MNSFVANLFLFPIGLGSSTLLFLSMFNGETISIFTDNGTYGIPIALLLFISFFYFMLDFVFMIIRYNPKNNIYFFHHALGLLIIPVVYFKQYHIVKYLMSYLMYELSTPFLNMSLQYQRLGICNIYSISANIVFIVSYTLIRILFGTYLLFTVVPIMYELNYPYCNLVVFPFLLQVLNYWWYYKIIRLCHRKK